MATDVDFSKNKEPHDQHSCLPIPHHPYSPLDLASLYVVDDNMPIHLRHRIFGSRIRRGSGSADLRTIGSPGRRWFDGTLSVLLRVGHHGDGDQALAIRGDDKVGNSEGVSVPGGSERSGAGLRGDVVSTETILREYHISPRR